MLFDEADKVITKYWLAQAATAFPGIPTVLDNDAADESPSYFRVSVSWFPDMQQTMGRTAKVQHAGMVSIKINVPPDAGTRTANLYLNAIHAFLSRAQLAGSSVDDYVKFGAMNPARPNGDDGEYFTTLVTIPFNFWSSQTSPTG